jgi:hypothetical protein
MHAWPIRLDACLMPLSRHHVLREQMARYLSSMFPQSQRYGKFDFPQRRDPRVNRLVRFPFDIL